MPLLKTNLKPSEKVITPRAPRVYCTICSLYSFSPPIYSTDLAAARHVAVAKASKAGQGQDRHLQGLYWKSVQLRASLDNWNIPEFFDENYWYYMSNILSTSNIGGNQPSTLIQRRMSDIFRSDAKHQIESYFH